jgi:hypothetical protein
MPLFNICGVQPFKRSFSVASVFLNAEKEDQYRWALSALQEFLAEGDAPPPRVIVTDREHALINALKHHETFTLVPRLLCRWHVNMNVLAKTKGFFPKATREPNGQIKRNPSFCRFLEAWNSLIKCATEDEFDRALAAFTAPQRFPVPAVKYALDTWIKPWKEELVDCWVNRVMHFGFRTTSIVESLHAGMKRFISSSAGDFASVFRRLRHFWREQAEGIRLARLQKMTRIPFGLSGTLFADVKAEVVPQALERVQEEQAAIPRQPRRGRFDLAPIEPCGNCTITVTFGLPCRHVLFEHLQADVPLGMASFDAFWHWRRLSPANEEGPAGPATPGSPRLLEPLVIRGKGRPKGAVATIRANTKRLFSAHEIAEAHERGEAVPPPSSAPPALQRPGPIVPLREIAVEDLPPDTPHLGGPQVCTTAGGIAEVILAVQGVTGDPYEAGTAAPRRSARIQQYYEDVDDEVDLLAVPEDELEQISTEFEGEMDACVSRLEQEESQRARDTQECIIAVGI